MAHQHSPRTPKLIPYTPRELHTALCRARGAVRALCRSDSAHHAWRAAIGEPIIEYMTSYDYIEIRRLVDTAICRRLHRPPLAEEDTFRRWLIDTAWTVEHERCTPRKPPAFAPLPDRACSIRLIFFKAGRNYGEPFNLRARDLELVASTARELQHQMGCSGFWLRATRDGATVKSFIEDSSAEQKKEAVS